MILHASLRVALDTLSLNGRGMVTVPETWSQSCLEQLNSCSPALLEYKDASESLCPSCRFAKWHCSDAAPCASASPGRSDIACCCQWCRAFPTLSAAGLPRAASLVNAASSEAWSNARSAALTASPLLENVMLCSAVY